MRPEDFLDNKDASFPVVESPVKTPAAVDPNPQRFAPQADSILTQSLEDQLLIDLSQVFYEYRDDQTYTSPLNERTVIAGAASLKRGWLFFLTRSR